MVNPDKLRKLMSYVKDKILWAPKKSETPEMKRKYTGCNENNSPVSSRQRIGRISKFKVGRVPRNLFGEISRTAAILDEAKKRRRKAPVPKVSVSKPPITLKLSMQPFSLVPHAIPFGQPDNIVNSNQIMPIEQNYVDIIEDDPMDVELEDINNRMVEEFSNLKIPKDDDI